LIASSASDHPSHETNASKKNRGRSKMNSALVVSKGPDPINEDDTNPTIQTVLSKEAKLERFDSVLSDLPADASSSSDVEPEVKIATVKRSNKRKVKDNVEHVNEVEIDEIGLGAPHPPVLKPPVTKKKTSRKKIAVHEVLDENADNVSTPKSSQERFVIYK
jgi:hypothetical protein